MARADELFLRVRQDILNEKYGVSGAEFLSVRDFSRENRCSPRVAVELFHRLEGEHLLRLCGKQYYVTAGHCLPSSPFGARLAGKGPAIFGVLTNDSANPFVGELTNRLCETANRDGTRLIVSNSGRDPELAVQLMEMFLDLRCRGVFICFQLPQELSGYLERYPLPIVTLADDTVSSNSDAILVSNYHAGKQVARHLCDCGCRTLAYITPDLNYDFDHRYRGFRDYLKAAGAPLADENTAIIPTAGTLPSARDISWFVRELLTRAVRRDRLPVGIFCFHDLLAVEAERAVKHYHAGKRGKLMIPNDVMIVGFDNLPIASQVSPTLTTVSYRYREIASKAYAVMLDYVGNPAHAVRKYEIPSALIVRESTAQKK